MAIQVLTDVKVYMGAYDLSGDHNAINADYAADLKDATTFGQTTRVRTGGLKAMSFAGKGFWSGGAGLVDDVLFGNIGVADVPVTLAPGGATLAGACYLFRANAGTYTIGGPVGELLPFDLSAEGSGGAPTVRGKLLHVGSETSTDVETGSQLGAVSATQRIYAAMHVISVSGTDPTLDVVLQSDDNSGFTSATARITFAQATAITSEWASLAGAVADDYWRASFTVGGTNTPTFGFILAVGII